MHEANRSLLACVVRLAQQHGGMSAADMIESQQRSQNLPGAMLVVRYECAVGCLLAGHDILGTNTCLAIARRLDDDGLDRLIGRRLIDEPLRELESSLESLV